MSVLRIEVEKGSPFLSGASPQSPARGYWYRAKSSIGKAATAFVIRCDIPEGFQGSIDAAGIDARMFPSFACWLAAWEAVEKLRQSTALDLGKGKFPLGREDLGPLVEFVQELDPGKCHAVSPTSLWRGVNFSRLWDFASHASLVLDRPVAEVEEMSNHECHSSASSKFEPERPAPRD